MPEPSTSILDRDGPLARALEGFEVRPAQARMMELVEQSFRDDGVLAVEAGTGTGKTFAYLVPAIRWAAATGEKVVVATHTIALQEQILRKDLPLVAAALGVEVKAALVKGRGNYLCRRKVAEAIDADARSIGESGRPPEEAEELVRIGDWVRDNPEGSRADLGFTPSPELWDDLRSDRDSCLRTRCAYHSRCYYYQARRASAKAEILIANHHLVMADLALKASLAGREAKDAPGGDKVDGVLPAYRRLILDEAHHLEDVAGSYFGVEVSRTGVLRLLHRLAGGDKRAGQGFLAQLAKTLESRAPHVDGALRAAYLDAADRLEKKIIPFGRWLGDAAAVAFATTNAWARAQPAEEGARGDGEKKVRLFSEPEERFRLEVSP
ncbi:MAG TPA: ATP-dependent DNA helicase, partial [bacterium]|nr:ATP-dependent DNA helicase [bacterium]